MRLENGGDSSIFMKNPFLYNVDKKLLYLFDRIHVFTGYVKDEP